MKFRDFLRILEAAGFTLVRRAGSHRTYEGWVDGRRHVVTLACHRESDDIRPGTLASMIRQSGLPRRRFQPVSAAAGRPTSRATNGTLADVERIGSLLLCWHSGQSALFVGRPRGGDSVAFHGAG